MEKYVCSQQEEILCPSFWWVQKTVTYCSAGSIEYTWLLYGNDFQVIELQAVNLKQNLGFGSGAGFYPKKISKKKFKKKDKNHVFLDLFR